MPLNVLKLSDLTEKTLSGKTVIVRVNLDVPVENGQVVDDFRLQGVAETVKFLTERNSKVILIGHVGRPAGKVVEELRLSSVTQRLAEILGCEIKKSDEVLGLNTQRLVNELKAGEILMLENIRFDPREEENDADFARKLAELGDIYVNECFGSSHRRHVSLVGIPQHLPSYAGLGFTKEIDTLTKIRENPRRPLVFIVGGSKKDKVKFVKKISSLADKILLGGKLMFAEELEGTPKVQFPIDAVHIDDIGPQSVTLFCKSIKIAKTVVWVGPLGRFEEDKYSEGTKQVARCVIEGGAFSVAGGGDTLAALQKAGYRNQFNFCSTGGGALLDFLADGTLPGIEALQSTDEM